MTRPLVSVAVITYNQKDFLREAVESILAQDYINIEIVIGDDASSDGTRELLETYAAKFPGKIIPVIVEQNTGITANSNRVHAACSGKYIAWLGGDDLMLPGKISAQVDFLEKNTDHNIVYHNLDIFESGSGQHIAYFNTKSSAKEGDMQTCIKYGTFNGAAATMVRRSASPEYGFDTRIPVASDWLYWVEHLRDGGKIGYINRVLGKYRRHEKNVTNTHSHHAPQGFSDLVETCTILQEKYPQFQKEIRFRLSEIYMSGRKYDFAPSLRTSLKYNPHNIRSLAALVIYAVSMKKIKI